MLKMLMLEKDDVIEIRQTLRMTLDEFAREVGAKANTVWQWENGRRFPSRRYQPALHNLKAKAERMKAFMASESA